MQRYQYLCKTCLILEERLVFSEEQALVAVTCSKCGRTASVLPRRDPEPGPYDTAEGRFLSVSA